MNQGKPVWRILRILGFIPIGLMNTILAKPEDIGTWKNYIGCTLILTAIIDLLLMLTKFKNGKMKNRPFDILLKISAFLIPFYFVFYGPLHENPENPKIKSLWKYVISGFSAYLVFGAIIFLFKN